MASVMINAKEVETGFRKVASGIPGADARAGKAALDIGVRGATGRVHTITGRLQKSIRMIENRPFFTRWGSSVEYAGHEEFRPGHSYMMPELHRMESGEILTIYMNQLKSV